MVSRVFERLGDFVINVGGVTIASVFILGIPLYLLSLVFPGFLNGVWLNMLCKWLLVGVVFLASAAYLWSWGYQSHQEKIDRERRSEAQREYHDKVKDDSLLRSLEEKANP